MTEEEKDPSKISFAFNDSDADEEEETPEDGEDEIDEVATLEQTLERREEQIEKLRTEVERMKEQTGDTGSEEVEALRAELEEVNEERDELRRTVSKHKNKMKEYRQRADKRKQQARKDAIGSLVSDLQKVRNTLVMALDQDKNTDIRDGVESTLEDLDAILQEHDITIIEPDVGDEVDAHAHKVVHRQASNEPAGHIEEVFDAGYQYDGRVLQPARVIVSTGEDTESED